MTPYTGTNNAKGGYTFAPNPGISTYQIKLVGNRTPASQPFVIAERTDIAS